MNLFKNHRFLPISLGVVTVLAIILYLILRPAPTLPIITPTPTVTPKVIPTLGIVPANPNQRLIINWNNLTIAPPDKLVLYTIIGPLINDQAIGIVATALGFRETDAKATLQKTSQLYTRDNRSLFASTSQNQVQFADSGPLPTKVGFENIIALEQQTTAYLNQFFKNTSFTKTDNTEYFLGRTDDYYPQIVSREKANLVRFAFQQTIAGYPLLTTATKNAIVVFTYDSNRSLRSLEISGGYGQTEPGQTVSLLGFDSLRQVATRLAVPLSLETTVDNKSLIDSQLVVTINLNSISLIYFAKPENNLIVPAFLLKGTLKGNFPDTPATYLVPAIK